MVQTNVAECVPTKEIYAITTDENPVSNERLKGILEAIKLAVNLDDLGLLDRCVHTQKFQEAHQPKRGLQQWRRPEWLRLSPWSSLSTFSDLDRVPPDLDQGDGSEVCYFPTRDGVPIRQSRFHTNQSSSLTSPE